jgi:hypothetical protein
MPSYNPHTSNYTEEKYTGKHAEWIYCTLVLRVCVMPISPVCTCVWRVCFKSWRMKSDKKMESGKKNKRNGESDKYDKAPNISNLCPSGSHR